jgi:3-methyladenine DNA glycosylase AlkD
MVISELKKDLREYASADDAKLLQGFFKTGKGQYGEGDIFIGVRVPNSRKIAKKHRNLALENIEKVLHSKIHEERLVALLILVERMNNVNEQHKIVKLYLKNTSYINNWDLVDLSASKIIGRYLSDKSRDVLYELAKSGSLWERRISIIAPYHFIRNNDFADTLNIAEILIDDKHDLIHKAVGWMLREVGKKSLSAEEKFLQKYYRTMPRTMLRYAIEKFDKKKKDFYMGRVS